MRFLLGPNTSTQMAVILFNDTPHYMTCKTLNCRILVIHQLVPAARRPPHNFIKIYTRPVTMDQAQSRPSPRPNLMIHYTTQLGRLSKEVAKHLKFIRHNLQGVELSMDTTQHPSAVLQSNRHPLNPKTQQSK